MKTPKQKTDSNGKEYPVMDLTGHKIVDGTSASVQSGVIDGTLIRLVNYSDTVAWVEKGANPTAKNDTDEGGPSLCVDAHTEVWIPVVQNTKIAVKGAKIAYSVAGE